MSRSNAPIRPHHARGRRRVLLAALLILVMAALLLAAGCEREARRFNETPPGASGGDLVTMNDRVQPGPVLRDPEAVHPYERNAWAISEGKTLYDNFNCAGCHSPRGGGNMGPSLIDSLWIYGAEPENIFQTIEQGRPRGMPAFRGRLGNTEIWKLVAYVRAMNGLVPADAQSARTDGMHENAPDLQTEPMVPEAMRVPPEEPDPHAKPAPSRLPRSSPNPADTARRVRPDTARKS